MAHLCDGASLRWRIVAMAHLCDGASLRWRIFTMAHLYDGASLRWRIFAMAHRSSPEEAVPTHALARARLFRDMR
jgi:hypothetical protein